VPLNEYGQPVGEPLPDWTPRAPIAPVTLTGRTVTLEPLGRQHLDDLWDALMVKSGPELWTYLSVQPFADRDAMAAYLDLLVGDDAFVPLAVVLPSGRAVGWVSYMAMDLAHGSVEIGGVTFSRELQRTPAATETISLTIRHALDDLGYRRFEWKCDCLNEPSRQAALRYGFHYEGRFRSRIVYKGRSRDTDWFSISADEWPAIRAAHEQWLDPSNFDADGHQLVSLRTLTAALPQRS